MFATTSSEQHSQKISSIAPFYYAFNELPVAKVLKQIAMVMQNDKYKFDDMITSNLYVDGGIVDTLTSKNAPETDCAKVGDIRALHPKNVLMTNEQLGTILLGESKTNSLEAEYIKDFSSGEFGSAFG